MSEQLVQKFIEALGRLESAREVEPIVELFSDDAEVGNVVSPEKFHGQAGAREFWTKYRETFGEVKSTFRNQIVAENRAALEWNTKGTATSDAEDAESDEGINYDGVSILEIDNERITRFRSYFDAGALGRQISGE